MPSLRRKKEDRPRTLRKDRTGASPFRVGVLVLIGFVAITYFGFTKKNPFAHPFEFKAVFHSANSIRLNSPVRIAGVNVGKVVKISGQDGTDNAVITMQVSSAGLPIHKDAELKIRPRIFLEGNFFVDLHPGTPSSPTISDGDTIPVDQTATPVQLDQVLTSLQQDTRRQLQVLLQSLGTALTAKPTPAEDADQTPYVRGLSAAQALNSAITFGKSALRDSTITQQALQGVVPSDLPGLVQGLAATGAKLASREQELGDLVENFNTTLGALASQESNLQAAVRELGPTVQTAYTSLGNLDAALPSVRAFSLAIIPGVEQTQPTIDAVTPWIAPTEKLVSQQELGGLLQNLQPATASLAKASAETIPVLKQGNLLSRCVTDVILPAGNVKLDDGPFSTGKENYKEFWYSMVGLAGEGQNFDGNGQYVRFQSGGGQYSVKLTGGNLGSQGTLYGNSVGKPLGTRPAWNGGVKPPYKPTTACYTQAVKDWNAFYNQYPAGPSDAG
ncbi:MAG TPA: MlaD family protein [Solirubrobacteraceae bacterium]|nr:MlaD family protein [Solirubrobacteraceae bacterium]